MEQQNSVQVVNGGGNGQQQGLGEQGNAGGTSSLIPNNNGNIKLNFYLCPSRGIRGNGLTDYGYSSRASSSYKERRQAYP